MAISARMEMPISIGEAAKLIRDGSFSCERLTRAYLGFAEKAQPKLNAFISLLRHDAVKIAIERDAELARGQDRGPLHGIPILVKDIYELAGTKTTLGSKAFIDRLSTKDATAISLLREAGAIFLGKTNMNEFAAGLSGVNEYFGDCHNPWSLDRSPGGSSSGNGAALAAGICLGGISTDTGGSLRIPASWCGIAGIRPTPGLVSLNGVFPRSHSFDCAGPHARNVMDLALLLDILASFDPNDPHSVAVKPEKSYANDIQKGVKGLKLALVKNYTYRNVDASVAAAIESAAEQFSKLGAKIIEMDIELLTEKLDYDRLYTNILLYEFNQILGEQYRAEKTPREIYGAVVRSNVEAGAKVSHEDYKKTIEERAKSIAEIRKVFVDIDAIITPASPVTALPLNSLPKDFDRARQFAIPFSYLALPSVVTSCGLDERGLPIGIQFVSDHFAEAKLLRIAYAFEWATDHHEKHPQLFFDRIE